MSKKLLKILKMISRDLRDKEFVSGEMIDSLTYDESDIIDISEELENLEFYDYLEDDETRENRKYTLRTAILCSLYASQAIYRFDQ